MTKSSLFAMLAALALSASPVLADDGDTKHDESAQHEGKEGKEAAKPKKGKGGKHAGHQHSEKGAEKNAGGEKK